MAFNSAFKGLIFKYVQSSFPLKEAKDIGVFMVYMPSYTALYTTCLQSWLRLLLLQFQILHEHVFGKL